MAGNFNMSVSNSGDYVRLKLSGDFDGSSACELANLLNCGALSNASKILVDTGSLKHIHPYGVDVLNTRLHTLNQERFRYGRMSDSRIVTPDAFNSF
jgi:hypothetical protein